ncbi:hypothetical protein [Deefgea salmonis]|uniref:Flagellar protein FliT n=1 Tax=Deefgea salmonis TaxID=2875502 RepID=A0ABS8BGE9_9NEIS|nr:hypothetical protein [Deefgea salmonis]MCB5194788.1 hypothetical protein [Deefgea salmonis]
MAILNEMQQLLILSESLLGMAKNEAWDDFFLAWPAYDELISRRSNINWLDFSKNDQIELKKILLEIETVHVSLIAASSAWRTELQDLLQTIVQSRKLSISYR